MNPSITFADEQNALAMLALSPEGYALWEACVAEVQFYSKLPSQQDGDLDCMLVFRNLDQVSPPRTIGPGRQCTCTTHISCLSLCPHQLLCDDGRFDIMRFAKRYHQINDVEHVNRVAEIPLVSHDAVSIDNGNDRFSLESSSVVDGGECGHADTDVMSSTQPVPLACDSSPAKNAPATSGWSTLSSDTNIPNQCESSPVRLLHNQKKKKMEFTQAMKYLHPLAEIIARHHDQDLCIGAVEGLKEILLGNSYDDNISLQDRTQNHLNQFNRHKMSQFNTNAPSGMKASGFASAISSVKHASHRTGSNRGKPGKERKRAFYEDVTNGAKRKTHSHHCHFCNERVEHNTKNSCAKYQNLKPFMCSKDKKLAFIARLGDHSLHKFVRCPPAVAKSINDRESSECKVQPWPMKASHMKLRFAYFDSDVPAIGTRYGNDPRVTNHTQNIIAVEFLETDGADPIVNSDSGDILFYYRVHELQDMINRKIAGDRLLFDLIPQINDHNK
jgi:hypothetical protein